MAKDPSLTVIRGRLAADPEYRTVGNQATPVVNLRILSSGWERDTAGQPVDVTPTSWNCEAWRGLAEHISASLTKGMQVVAVAFPKTDKYTAQDGTERWSTRWVIEDIGASLQFATAQVTKAPGRRGNGNGMAAQPPQPASQQGYTGGAQGYTSNDEFETGEW